LTTLETRQFGNSGIDITSVGAGTWAIGGLHWKYNWGPQDDACSVRALRHAVESGINWVDTAAAYGLGHAEEIVGRAISAFPEADRPLVFTKCGLRWSEADRWGDPHNFLRPDSIRMECEASLRRLGAERIDLYQFHWPDPKVPVEDSWAVMCDLIDEGKVRLGGVSNFDIPLLERCEAMRHVASLQPPFSLIDRRAGAGLAGWCADHGTAVICYSPMQAGLLSDTFSLERVALMDERDWRRWHYDFTHFSPPALHRNLALRDRLRPVAERHATTVASVAIAWALSWRGVTGAIVGVRSPDQVAGWLGAGSVQLKEDDFDEIASAIDELGAGDGPTRPS